MLQWMGGSRRKVTTSRKSTQKRQKQYFEQRRRQQQDQQATGLEISSDGVSTCSQYQNNNRSLDILSLLNLSTVVQDRKSSCYSSRETSEGCAMTDNYPITKCPPATKADKVTPGDLIEVKKARNPPVCQVETVYPKKVLSSAPDSQNRDLFGHGNKTDQSKMASEHQLSVFDLLGDDGLNDNLEESPQHEAHVAFAVEGLGKVETETPVHSPQQPGRNFTNGSSAPLKAARQPQSSKNFNDLLYDLELEVGGMNQDSDSSNFLEMPFYSTGVGNSFSKPRQKLSTAKECSRLNSNARKLHNSFEDDEIFYNIKDVDNDTWKASNFVEGNFLDEDCAVAWKNKPLEMDGSNADYWDLGDHEMSDFALEGPFLKKNWVTKKASGRFNVSDSPVPYVKQRRSTDDHDFISPDGTWYRTVGRDGDLTDVTNQPAWSCYAGESLSMLSEESCSSSAVRGKATRRSPSNSVARQNIRRHGSGIRSPVNECSVEKIYAKDRHYAKRDDVHEGKNISRPGKFTKICDPSSSNPAHFSSTVFAEKLGPEVSFWFEEGHNSNRDSRFSPFCPTSEAKKDAFAGSKLWTEDPFGAYPLPKVHANGKSSFERSKHDVLHEFSCSGSFSSEKPSICEPYSHAHSYETPIFSPIGSGRSKPNSFMDSKVEGISRNLFPVEGFQRDAEFLHVSVEESVAKIVENRSGIQPTDCVTLQKDACMGSNDLSSENGQPLEASDSKDNCSECMEAKDLIPEMDSQKASGSLEHADEISSSVKTPDKFEDNIDEKEYHHDAETSLPRQNGTTAVTNLEMEIDDSGAKERKLKSNGQSTSLSPSCQVMMLESYVLQLLCVQKVLKEASVHDIVRKV